MLASNTIIATTRKTRRLASAIAAIPNGADWTCSSGQQIQSRHAPAAPQRHTLDIPNAMSAAMDSAPEQTDETAAGRPAEAGARPPPLLQNLRPPCSLATRAAAAAAAPPPSCTPSPALHAGQGADHTATPPEPDGSPPDAGCSIDSTADLVAAAQLLARFQSSALASPPPTSQAAAEPASSPPSASRGQPAAAGEAAAAGDEAPARAPVRRPLAARHEPTAASHGCRARFVHLPAHSPRAPADPTHPPTPTHPHARAKVDPAAWEALLVEHTELRGEVASGEAAYARLEAGYSRLERLYEALLRSYKASGARGGGGVGGGGGSLGLAPTAAAAPWPSSAARARGGRAAAEAAGRRSCGRALVILRMRPWLMGGATLAQVLSKDYDGMEGQYNRWAAQRAVSVRWAWRGPERALQAAGGRGRAAAPPGTRPPGARPPGTWPLAGGPPLEQQPAGA
jgi:hypothetical protein